MLLWGWASASALAAVSVSLAWNPSSDVNVAGYKIYYGLTSRNYTSSVDVGNVSKASIGGLQQNTTYYFAATTYDSAGNESDFSNEASYSSNVTPTLPPTLNALNDLAVPENSGLQTVNLSGISPGSGSTVSLSVVSSNPGLIPNPTVNYASPNATGSLTFAAQTNAFGSAVITVTANNGQAQSNLVTRSFTVTVSQILNPTLDPIADVTLAYGEKPAKITLTGIQPGTAAGKKKMKITAVSSNPQLLPNPKVSYRNLQPTGSLLIKPIKNAVGTSLITVTVDDGGTANNLVTRQFSVTVKPNQPPTLNPINDVVLAYGAKGQTIDLTGLSCGDPAEGQKLKISAVSSNPKVIPNPKAKYANRGNTGTLNFTPKAKASGTAMITVTVNDGAKTNNLVTRLFSITVSAQNEATNNTVAAVATVPEAAFLSAPVRSNGHFAFTVNGTSGQQYIVQVSSDLIHWTSVETNTAPFSFDDASAGSAAQKFYRTVGVSVP
jgi:hypothetical protein